MHVVQAGLIPDSQCGFGKGTTETMFTARRFQEKGQEQTMDLYMTFINLAKVFDIVSHDGLWKIMTKFGCPSSFIAMVLQFHVGMRVRV